MSYNYLFKLIIIGDSGVGKSCILLQFTDNRFRKDHDLTIGVEFGAKLIDIKEKKIHLQIWDTAGQENFRSITRAYYRSAAGALLMFDLTRRESFDKLSDWLQETLENGNPHMVIVLVGNKLDLEEERQVEYSEAEAFAKANGLVYLETSALTGHNVQEAFLAVGEQIIDKVESLKVDPKIENYGVKLGVKDPKTKKKKCCK